MLEEFAEVNWGKVFFTALLGFMLVMMAVVGVKAEEVATRTEASANSAADPSPKTRDEKLKAAMDMLVASECADINGTFDHVMRTCDLSHGDESWRNY